MKPNASRLFAWALRSLMRSHRVRFATAIGFVFHILSTFTLIRLYGAREIPMFVYLVGFIPVAILAAVTQGNVFGVDRGGTLTAFAAPVSARTFSRLRLVAALLWTVGTLLIGWIVGATAIGLPFFPIVLLQLAFVFLLCAIGGMLSVVAPSSRAYARTTGQTMPVTSLVPLNVVSLLAIAGASKLLASANGIDAQLVFAIACMLTTLAMEVATVVVIGHLFESRRDHIMDALRENP